MKLKEQDATSCGNVVVAFYLNLASKVAITGWLGDVKPPITFKMSKFR